MLKLRPYQEKAKAAVQDGFRRHNRVLCVMPTGTGKTVVFSHLAAEMSGRFLVVVHRDELVRQAVDKLHAVTGEWPGVIKGQENTISQRITVASVQTLCRERRLEAYLSRGAPSVIVVDEAHHAPAETYMRTLRALGAWETDDGPKVVGFTATGFRGDNVGLDAVFETVVYERGMLPFIAEGYLADIQALQVKLDVDFSELKVSRGDFTAGSCEDVLMAGGAPTLIAQAFVEYASTRKALVFTPTIRVSQAVKEALAAQHVAAEHVDGATPENERRAIIRAFAAGEVRVVSNCAVLTEGFDEPTCDCVVMARPTKSKTLYVQCVGRGTRTAPGKKDLLLLDLVGNVERHDLLTMAKLMGLEPEGVLKKRGLVAAIQEAEEAENIRAKLRAEAVSVFSRSSLNWITEQSRMILSLGSEGNIILDIEAHPESGIPTWSIWRVWRQASRWQRFPSTQRQKLYAGLTLDYAQGIAEDMVRKAGAKVLNDPAAPWRAQPASDAQRARLERRGLWKDGMTKGEASDLITRLVTR